MQPNSPGRGVATPQTVSIILRAGGGRGAYEITGLQAAGHQLRDVLNKSLVLFFPPHLAIRTQLRVVESGGKARFITEHKHFKRLAAGPGPAPQGNELRINRQLAAALLMPGPTSYTEHPAAVPAPSSDGYMIWSIGGILTSINGDQFTIVPTEVTLRSGLGDTTVDPRRRFRDLAAVWARRAVYPDEISELLKEHEAAVKSGGPISDEACALVERLQTAMVDDPSEAWGQFSEEMDPLPALDAFSPPAEPPMGKYKVTHAPTVISYSPGDAAPPYTPDGSDQRARVKREIAARRGQAKFRNALRRRYGDICLVSGCAVIDALEAAHIVPFLGEKDNNPENGLLLRADIHTLFDLDLVGIDPASLKVHFHPKLHEHYHGYEGGRLRCSDQKRPSRSALDARYKCFLIRTKKGR